MKIANLSDKYLPEDSKEIRNGMRKFVDETILARPEGYKLPFIVECYRNNELPLDKKLKFEDRDKPITLRELLSENALFSMCLSANMKKDGKSDEEIIKYGGVPGFNNFHYGIAMKEIERGDSGLRSFISVQGGLVMHAIYSCGSEEQKLKWLPQLASGEIIGCFGATESGSGSNVAGYKLKAIKSGNYYILSGGSKEWITNATIADIAIVWAKTEDGALRGFIVEKNTPGFKDNKIEYKNTMNASDTGCLEFTDCKIPAENILPIYDEKTNGVKSLLQCFSQARFGICWGVIGAAQACFEAVNDLLVVQKHQVQGGALAGKQISQQKLVEMRREFKDMMRRVIDLSQSKDDGTLSHVDISEAKLENCKSAIKIALLSIELLGKEAFTDLCPPMRHLRNLLAVATYEGTAIIHTLIIGKDFTGISAI